MEKVIEIDGKQVRLKSTGATPLRYKAQFGRDFFAEIMKMGTLEKLNKEKITPKDLEGLDFEVFYNFTFILAKTADNSIIDPISWLDDFETFPMIEVIPQIQDMLLATIQSKKK